MKCVTFVPEWMDHDDPLQTRMFYELMQAYRHAGINQENVIRAFEEVQLFIREYCTTEPQEPAP